MKSDAEAHESATKVIADSEAQIIMVNAAARLESSQNLSSAAITKARAEGQAAQVLEASRKHDEELEKVNIQVRMAKQAKMVISGQNGEQILNFYKKTLQ